MKTIEDIESLIKDHPLVTVTPATTRVLKTPEEIRREADLDRLDHTGKVIEKLHSSGFRKRLHDAADKGETVTLTTPQKITINRENVRTVESIIRRDWIIREITSVAQCTRGIITETREESRELTRIFESLVRSCYLYIGAASILKMQDARLIGGCAFADEGDGPTLYDYTLDALIRAVPKEYGKQLDAASKLDDIQKEMLHKGDLKEYKRYKIVPQHGSDGRKPLKKEIAQRLGISRPTLDHLLKNPDNEWGLRTECIQSWQAFDFYCQTHEQIIESHKANKNSKLRKRRPKIVHTASGNTNNSSQSATLNFKPHGRNMAKPKR